MQGKFIVFEGIDGAGTETQSKRLLEYLRKKEIPAERLQYPDYSGPVGNLIREYLYRKHDFNPEVQFLLFLTDMIKDRGRILSWLREGKFVICDRYITTTLAYQGAQDVDVGNMLAVARLLQLPRPDSIIYLKISAETSITRKLNEKNELDRNEANEKFLRSVSNQYKSLIGKKILGEWLVIDGEQDMNAVFEEIKSILKI